MNDLRNVVEEIREQKRLKKTEIADALGIDVSNYNKFWTKGNGKLTLDQAERIAKALGLSLVELLTYGEERPAVASGAQMGELARLKTEAEELKTKQQSARNAVSLALFYAAETLRQPDLVGVGQLTLEQAYPLIFSDTMFQELLRYRWVHTLIKAGLVEDERLLTAFRKFEAEGRKVDDGVTPPV